MAKQITEPKHYRCQDCERIGLTILEDSSGMVDCTLHQNMKTRPNNVAPVECFVLRSGSSSMTTEERNEQLNKEVLATMEEGTDVTPEEYIENYWKLIDVVRTVLSNLTSEMLQAKCLLYSSRQDREIAGRPDEKGEWMVCCPTGKQTITIELIDLDAREAFLKWKSESEHVPTIVEASDER